MIVSRARYAMRAQLYDAARRVGRLLWKLEFLPTLICAVLGLLALMLIRAVTQ